MALGMLHHHLQEGWGMAPANLKPREGLEGGHLERWDTLPLVGYRWWYLSHPWKKAIGESLAARAYGSWTEKCTWKLTSIPPPARARYKFPKVRVCKCEWKRWSLEPFSSFLGDHQGNNINLAMENGCGVGPQRNMPRGEKSAKTCEEQFKVYNWTWTEATEASQKKTENKHQVKHVPCPEGIKHIYNISRYRPFPPSSTVSFQLWRGWISTLAIGVRVVDAQRWRLQPPSLASCGFQVPPRGECSHHFK